MTQEKFMFMPQMKRQRKDLWFAYQKIFMTQKIFMFMPQMQRQRKDLWFAPQIIRKYLIICGANDTGKIYVYASNEKTTKGFMVCAADYQKIFVTQEKFMFMPQMKRQRMGT